METIKAIKTRRSVRQFNDKQVSEENVKQLLDSAMCAPSAYNRQPWRFIVLNNPEVLHTVASVGHYAAVGNATAAILVCGDLNAEEDERLLIQGCSAATENLLLTANSLGLATVWTSIYPFEEMIGFFREIFELPENILPITIIPVGYSDHDVVETSRFEKKNVHYNKW